MGLRCIIGHDYGDPETTEQREERAKERVVTVKEYRECSRCGHRKVMSENTEVRSIETETTEAETPPNEPSQSAEPRAEPEEPIANSNDFEETSAEEDDGVILEEQPTEEARERGEWPETDEEDTPTEAESEEEWPDDHLEENRPDDETEIDQWPEHESDDEGFEAEPGSVGPTENVDFGGLTPERLDARASDSQEGIETSGVDDTQASRSEQGGGLSKDSDGESGPEPTASGIRRAETTTTPTTQQRSATRDATFVCPQCGFTKPARGSSLRKGDICPECQKGYLTERTE